MKLKPCPFCEGKVTIDNDGNTQWISCEKCGYESCFINEDFWNNRPLEDALVTAARVEALKWARDIIIGIDLVTTQQGALNMVLDEIGTDKLIDKEKFNAN